jgi:hypothetical protein
MMRMVRRLLAWLGLGRRPPGAAADPYAWRPVPLKPRPKVRHGAVAVAEPEDD